MAAKLRAGGAVLLGKLNLSEWANFRSFDSSSGWSGRGGQCNNPYAIDRNPCGSSSGSGAAVSANLCAVSLGSETDGSIVCPSSLCGVVGIKPTVGLTSRAGVVPISHIQDTIGPHARTVADAAAVLGVIQSQTSDGRDPATGDVPLGRRGLGTRPMIPGDYTQFLNPDGLRGRRIGVTGQGVEGASPDVAAIFDTAIATMEAAGAILVDLDAEGFEFPPGAGEFLVLLFDFVGDLQAYLATRSGVPLAGGTLADAIAFNEANADREMPFFGQEIFELAAALEEGEDTPQPLFDGMIIQRGAPGGSGRYRGWDRCRARTVQHRRDRDADGNARVVHGLDRRRSLHLCHLVAGRGSAVIRSSTCPWGTTSDCRWA